MAGLSEIEWTDATWNPIAGCTMISPGCTNCYAMRMAARLQAMRHPSYVQMTRKSGGRAVWTGKLRLIESALSIPLSWRKPRKIFVNSMSDLFQDGVPTSFIGRVWDTMEKGHWHTYQILTKRPDNMVAALHALSRPLLDNVWLGTSVEAGNYKGRITESTVDCLTELCCRSPQRFCREIDAINSSRHSLVPSTRSSEAAFAASNSPDAEICLLMPK
jgi:protein gp37